MGKREKFDKKEKRRNKKNKGSRKPENAVRQEIRINHLKPVEQDKVPQLIRVDSV